MDNLEEENDETPSSTDNSQTTDDKEIRRKQQQEGSLREVKKYKAYADSKDDINVLLELHNEDPKLADDVARLYKYDSYAELMTENSSKDQTDN